MNYGNLTPYQIKLQSVQSKASRLGLVKYQVSGRAPAIEETEEEKQKAVQKAVLSR